MPSAPLAPNELERLAALRDLEILDSAIEPQFDALVNAASSIAGTPIALVSLVDEDRQWFKARMGLGDVRQTDRCDAFCAYTILEEGAMEVHDTLLEGRKAALELIRRTTTLASSEANLASANLDLRRANEDLRSFVQVASHDLKSPLLTIARLAEWAVDSIEEGKPEAASEHLELLGQRVMRMETLLADLRQFATLGRAATRVETVDTWSLVERTFQWHEGNPHVRLELAGKRSHITTQVAPLEIVLRNLIGNSIKHRGDTEPTIVVTTLPHSSGDAITLTVVDDGPGIESQFHESVFEPFQTLQSRDKTEGSGLGLAIVKRTVDQVGGSIQLESDGVTGTTFRLTWPLETEVS